MLNLLSRKSSTSVTVKYGGIKFSLDLTLPIIARKVSEMLAERAELRLSTHRNKKLSPEKVIADCKARIAQIKAYREAEEAAPYSASVAEMERTAKLLALKMESVSGIEPIIFVGDSNNANVADFAFQAALVVATKAHRDHAHHVKALLQMGIEAAEAEVWAARDLLTKLIPDFVFNEQTVIIELEANQRPMIAAN